MNIWVFLWSLGMSKASGGKFGSRFGQPNFAPSDGEHLRNLIGEGPFTAHARTEACVIEFPSPNRPNAAKDFF